MNDDDTLAALRHSLGAVTDSLTDVHLRMSADQIRARARARGLRRGLSGAGAGAACLALGAGLLAGTGPAAVPVGGFGPGTAGAAGHGKPVHVNLDAWSVNTGKGGVVYVSIRKLQDASYLRRVLAEAGVPALVTFGELCHPARPSGYVHLTRPVLGHRFRGSEMDLTINPAAMPPGTELNIGIVEQAKFTVTGIGVIKDHTPLTCGRSPVVLPEPVPSPSASGGVAATPVPSPTPSAAG